MGALIGWGIAYLVVSVILIVSGGIMENMAMSGHRQWPTLREHSKIATAEKIERARALRKYAIIWPVGLVRLTLSGSAAADDLLMEVKATRAREAVEKADKDLAASRRKMQTW